MRRVTSAKKKCAQSNVHAYIQTTVDRYTISQLVAEKALDAWEKTVCPPMSWRPCPHSKDHYNNSSTVLYTFTDFDGISYGKEHLTFLKQNIRVCGGTDFLLSEHELAQERLYRLWRAGWVRGENVLVWAQSLKRLSLEGDCDYLVWLLQRFPRLCENEEYTTSDGSVRGVEDARTTEGWFPPAFAA